jgi:hypothetical protein
MTFGEHGSSAEAKRGASTTRVREFRKRQKLGLTVRKVRINTGTVRKLIALGYLGDEKAEGMAIEAYLGDSLLCGGHDGRHPDLYRSAAVG